MGSGTAGALSGRRALVIGAGTPAGGIAAKALAGAGVDVAVASTSLEGDEVMAVRRVRRVVEALGRRTAEYAFDLALGTNVRVSTRQVAKEMGGLDVLVNAADLCLRQSSEQMSDSDWNRVLSVNLTGVFYACRAALHEMRERGGRIVTICSVPEGADAATCAAYAAARQGVAGLTRALAAEYAASGITVNLIALPFTPPPNAAPSLGYDRDVLQAAEGRLTKLLLSLCAPEGVATNGQVVLLPGAA
ncbi:MAG TPA: SDR family NAD(P)-dependent oxidoreductase [Dehalococcoidia bacterium]|nr:SDR family NAD(P)-dependent oxidoreductase [Dehalococcoidia bacterium]